MSERLKVTLLMDGSDASRRAFNRLSGCDVELTTVGGCNGYMLPSASLDHAFFDGRQGIDFLADRLPKKE